MEPMLNAIRPTGQKAANPDIKPVEDADAVAAWADALSSEMGAATPMETTAMAADTALDGAPGDEAPEVEVAETEADAPGAATDPSDIDDSATPKAVATDPAALAPQAEPAKGETRAQRRVGAREALTRLSPEVLTAEPKAHSTGAANALRTGATQAVEQAGLSPLGQQISQLARAQSGKPEANGDGEKSTPTAAVAAMRSSIQTTLGNTTKDATPAAGATVTDAMKPAPDVRVEQQQSHTIARDRTIANHTPIATTLTPLAKPKIAAKEAPGVGLEPVERPGPAHLAPPAPDTPTRASPLVDAPTRSEPMMASVSRQLTAAITPLREGVTEVRLTPEELGRVRMTVSTVDGALHIAISADRPETTDLMRRSLDQLRQELNEMGFDDADIDLQHGQQDQQDKADQPRDWTNTRTVALADNADPEPLQRQVVSDRLDLRL